MTATEQTQPISSGRITRWRIGDHDHWATLAVDLGVIQADVHLTSREAREFALAVLTEQGPFLGYQPPNPTMRESPTMAPFDTGRRNEPGWRQREKIRIVRDRLSKLADEYGDDVFGWALQRLHES